MEFTYNNYSYFTDYKPGESEKVFFDRNLLIVKALEKEIIILHPGPINRGIELTSRVADSDNALILDQVENGVAVRMAILYLLASK